MTLLIKVSLLQQLNDQGLVWGVSMLFYVTEKSYVHFQEFIFLWIFVQDYW